MRPISTLLLAACLLLTGAAAAEQGATRVHPWLEPVLQNPEAPLPPLLTGELGGWQGRKQLNGQPALSLHLRTTASRESLEAMGVEVRSLRDGRATVTLLPSLLGALVNRPDVEVVSLPRPIYPLLNSSVPDTGTDSLRSESGGLFSGATGSGVVVGVVDSGIDFDHANFTDPSGNTRIAYLWDQQVTDLSRAPSPYGYGTEWTAADIDGGLCSEEDDPDAWGHGTHVTGIAAGNGAAPDAGGTSYTYTGMAPESTIVFVKTDWSSDGIIDAMEYIFDRADDLGLPAVVNLSLGTQLGAHDGTDPMEEAIDSLVSNGGRAVVVAAGNERTDEIHAELNAIPFASVLGPDFEVASYTPRSGSSNDYVLLAGYYPDGDDLTVHLFSPAGDYYTRNLNTSIFSSGCSSPATGTDGTVQICNNHASNLDQSTADNEIVIFIWDDTSGTPPGAGAWSMALTANTVVGSGEVDFWMLSSLGGSSSKAVFTSHVEEHETLGIPATSQEAITVGAYVTKICWQDYTGTSRAYSGSYDVGDLAPFSSAGPTRDGRNKPEVAAPGMGIVSALADEVRSDLISGGYGAYVINDSYLLIQGTSQATPHVTGAVALLFEEDASYTVDDVKSILTAAAREDDFTAAYDEPHPLIYPLSVNYSFGAGKLDLGPWAYEDDYETNDTLRNATGILSGQAVDAYLDHGSDVDTFHLDALSVGDTVDVELTSLPGDYRLRLVRALSVGSCGALLGTVEATSDNLGTADESLSHTLSTLSAPKYVRVDSAAGAYDPALPYALTAILTRPETGSFHGSTASAQVLPEFEEMRVSGAISYSGEQDYYQLTAKGGQTITLSVGFLRSVAILDSTGTVVASGPGSTSYSLGFVSPFIVRTFYARVSGYSTLFPAYTLTLEVR